MHIDTAETLHQQHDEEDKWDTDLIIQTILEILKGPLNDGDYRNVDTDEAQGLIGDYLKVLGGTKYEKRANRINKKVAKLKSTREIILYLGEVILGD